MNRCADFHRATILLKRAVVLRPNDPVRHVDLGESYRNFGEYRRDRLLSDGFEAAARIPRGVEHARIGIRGAGDPEFARLASLLRGRLPDDGLEVIERLLADPQLGPQPRARLLFALGHVLDARGAYARAAVCLREANALTLESNRSEEVVYQPESYDRFVGRLMEAFDRDFFRRTAGLGLAAQRPVFVVGLPRTGTTLVEQILPSHPQVYGAAERFFGRRSFEGLTAAVGRNGSRSSASPPWTSTRSSGSPASIWPS